LTLRIVYTETRSGPEVPFYQEVPSNVNIDINQYTLYGMENVETLKMAENPIVKAVSSVSNHDTRELVMEWTDKATYLANYNDDETRRNTHNSITTHNTINGITTSIKYYEDDVLIATRTIVDGVHTLIPEGGSPIIDGKLADL